MIKKIFNSSIMVILILTVLSSCGSDQEQDVLAKSDLIDTAYTNITISDEAINGIMNSIPSPLETVSMIKESGLQYNESYLNPSINYEDYKSKYEKSFAIGVYSADLGYLNLYEKNIASISYIVAVKKLSEELSIGQFFDFETLKRLSSNKKNLDSLLYLSTSCFNKMDSYLRKNNRSEQSSLIIIGAWLEGLYFETEMAKKNPSQKTMESIGSKKTAINNILAILNAYKTDEYFKMLYQEMKRLENVFEQVNITYNYKEPEVKEVNGELIVIDQSETKIEISEPVFNDILNITGEIRRKVLNLNEKSSARL
jgi:hypothetical protein